MLPDRVEAAEEGCQMEVVDMALSQQSKQVAVGAHIDEVDIGAAVPK